MVLCLVATVLDVLHQLRHSPLILCISTGSLLSCAFNELHILLEKMGLFL